MNPVKIILIVAAFWLTGCGYANNVKHYKYIGEIGFRKSYAGITQWPDSYLDSVLDANPAFYGPADSITVKLFNLLASLGVTRNNELLFDSLILKGGMVIREPGVTVDSIFLKRNSTGWVASVEIRSGGAIDSIPFDDDLSFHELSLVSIKSNQPYLILLDKWYIMNGDNYDISVYEKK